MTENAGTYGITYNDRFPSLSTFKRYINLQSAIHPSVSFSLAFDIATFPIFSLLLIDITF